MPKPEEEPQAEGLGALYISEKPIECKIMGVVFKLKDISGEEFLELSKDCKGPDGKTVDDTKYMHKLIDATVLSPKIDVSKLNMKAYTLIGDEIQKALGLSELVSKNLKTG